MEKMDSKTKDFISANISELKKLFPQCVKEGKIDFEELKEFLGAEIIPDGKERYSFTWAGKKNAKKMALLQTSGTLRPAPEESVEWDKTQNLFIEGDNLEAMRAMFKSYAGQIKMIYIDPPYNTGNDFVYKDDFSDNIKNYVEKSDQALEANPETNGRYHSEWLDMMYPRLMLARDLLREDGVIFVSIDDNEVHDLRMLMNEIFGEENFQGTISRVTGTPTGGGNKAIVNEIDYVMVYYKSSEALIEGLSLTSEEEQIYDKNDEKGRYLIRPLRRTGGEDRREDRPTMFYPLIAPDGDEIYPYAPAGYESRWICGKEKYKELQTNGLIEWNKIKKDGKEVWQVYQKFYLEGRLKQPSNLWKDIEGNKKATRDLKELFDDKKIFEFPKPSELIRKMIQMCSVESDQVILDFFAGSGTTAQAVLEQNTEDGGKRKFILIQLPESTPEDSEARKAGYKTIADICKERIRRVIKKIKAEQSQKKLSGKEELDLGFKVFKLDTTNIRSWDSDPQNLQRTLDNAESTLKDGRTSEDVLYEILLKYGISLTSPIKEEKIGGKTIYNIGEGYLYICLDKNIGKQVIDHLLKLIKENKTELGTRVLFADHCFENDKDSVNAEVRLKQAGVEDIKKM